MNRICKLLAFALAVSFGSLDAQQDPEYLTPPTVAQDINSVDLLSGRYEPEVPELSIPAAPRLAFKHLQQFVVRIEGTKYQGTLEAPTEGSGEEPTIIVPPANYDLTYMGNTSERIKCNVNSGDCTPEENYGSLLIGGFSSIDSEFTYTQGQTGALYHYDSPEFFQQFPPGGQIHQKGSWWVSEINYADGEKLTFHYDTADGSTSDYIRYPHRPQKVVSDIGYEIRFTYVSNQWTDSSVEWYQLKTAAIYKTSIISGFGTLLAKFTYTVSGGETTVTDLLGRQWKYSGYENRPGVLPAASVTGNFTLKLPGNSFNTVSVTRYTSGAAQGLVNTVTRNGLTYTYTYSGFLTGSKFYTGLVITGPALYRRTLVIGHWGLGLARQPHVLEDIDRQGRKTKYTYEGRRIKTITYPEGNKVTYGYDPVRGNVTSKLLERKTGFQYDDEPISVVAHYPSTCVEAQCFKPDWITDGRGNTTQVAFAPHGGLLTKTEPPNDDSPYRRVTTNEWEPSPSEGIWRLERTTKCFQHECGTSSKNVRITEYTYWGETQLPKTVTTRSSASSASATVTYNYDSAGRLLSEDGPLSGTGDAIHYRYDAAGRRTWEIGRNNALNQRVAKKLTLRSQDSQPLTIQTGTLSSPTDSTLSIDTTETIAYTTHGLPKTLKTIAGGITFQLKQISYDARNRVDCEVQRMNPARFSLTQPSACFLGQEGDFGPDRITKYTYDTESRTRIVTSGYGTPDAGIDIQLTYTDNGQVKSRGDGENHFTLYRYDGHDRLERVTFEDNSYEEFGYDANGNRTSWRKRDGTTLTYDYDESNYLRKTTVTGESAINYPKYDGVGRLREVNRDTSNKTEYDFDDRGYLNRSETNGYPITYLNDAAGRVEAITYPQGQVIEYVYDDSNAVTDIDARHGFNTLAVADYVYDDMGRLTDVFLGDGGATGYNYDPIGRLNDHTLKRAGQVAINLTTLAYNPSSQIASRSVTQSSYQTAMPSGSPAQYTPNNLNQYSFVDVSNPLSYEPNGNLTAYDGWTYSYDAHNRLKSASRPGTSLTLTYDPTGRLNSTTLAGSTTEYAYSGDQLIGEYTQPGSPINLYVYPPGSDIPIARFSGTQGLNDFQYLRSDERGSIVAVTDDIVLESHQYDVYGVPLDGSDSLFRYTGQILLPGTELYHYKARAYHPALGRFMQTDPIGYEDGMNMYAYVGNDPVNSVDPSGLAKVCTAVTGSRIKSCVGVDGNGDGDVTDNDLTHSQISTMSNDFATYIQSNSGRNISASGATVIGEDNDQTRFIRAVSQFVGDAMGGWDGITIQMGDSGLLKYASRSHVDSETRGLYIHELTMIGINTDSQSTFAKAGNAGRTLIHERLHRQYRGAFLSSRSHRALDEKARGLLRSYGLGDGGCEAIGGIFGLFPTYPACN